MLPKAICSLTQSHSLTHSLTHTHTHIHTHTHTHTFSRSLSHTHTTLTHTYNLSFTHTHSKLSNTHSIYIYICAWLSLNIHEVNLTVLQMEKRKFKRASIPYPKSHKQKVGRQKL